MTNETYKCTLDEMLINIDSSALKRTLFLCYRTQLIIGLLVTISISIVSLITGIIMLMCYRTRKSKQRRHIEENFLNQLLHGHCDEKYLIFISYCNENEEDEVRSINEVEPALKTHMLEIFNIPKKFTVTGNSMIKVGFCILNEVMRSIKESCVILCLISQSYCDNQWCQTEFKEAVEQDKPVVLLFLEDVKRQNMSELMWTILNRNTRSTIILKDGMLQPIDGLHNLCESIVTLACSKYYMDKIEKCKKRKRNESINSEEKITFI